jgi:hypothetical protein
MAVPRRVQNTASAGCPDRSSSQNRSAPAALPETGVILSLRPLWQRWDKGRYLDVSVMPMMQV